MLWNSFTVESAVESSFKKRRGYQVCDVILNMADFSQDLKRKCVIDKRSVTFTAPITVI